MAFLSLLRLSKHYIELRPYIHKPSHYTNSFLFFLIPFDSLRGVDDELVAFLSVLSLSKLHPYIRWPHAWTVAQWVVAQRALAQRVVAQRAVAQHGCAKSSKEKTKERKKAGKKRPFVPKGIEGVEMIGWWICVESCSFEDKRC